MNAEQLHSFATIVVEDIEQIGILKYFSRFVDHLELLANNPGDESAQRSVQDSRIVLFESLESLEKKRWTAGLQQTIVDLGGPTFDSDAIKDQINISLQASAMTPATARDQVDKFVQISMIL